MIYLCRCSEDKIKYGGGLLKFRSRLSRNRFSHSRLLSHTISTASSSVASSGGDDVKVRQVFPESWLWSDVKSSRYDLYLQVIMLNFLVLD